MPDTPAWAARAALYIVIGFIILCGLPVMAWLGRREVSRWESKLEELEDENKDLRKEMRALRQELRVQMQADHDDVAEKLDAVLDEVQS